MKYKTVFYPDIDGKPVQAALEDEEFRQLLSGQPLRVDSAERAPVTLCMDGSCISYGLPCVRISEQEDCPRRHLRRAADALSKALAFDRFRVSCDFYVFPRQMFPELVVSQASHLQPCACEALDGAQFTVNHVNVSVSRGEDGHQYRLSLDGTDLAAILDARLAAQQEIDRLCSQSGTRPFWVPKLDGLSPSGLEISLTGTQKLPADAVKAALLGLYEHIKPMTLVFCTQVNSYKRITPKRVTPGQRIPCCLRCSAADDRNALAAWSEAENTLTCFLADNYCNPYLAAAGVLYMLSDGVSRYAGHDNEARWQQFLSSQERMPNSLTVACELWKKDPFSREVFGESLWRTLSDNATREWEEYCDVAHPWELLRGVQFEQESNDSRN